MNKPNNYDNVQGFEGFTPLELGGHICVIKKVEEAKAQKSGKDMLRIYLDTDRADKQPKYFEDRFKSDTRENKKWGCIVYQMVLDTNGDTSRGFKTFIESVEKSNNGFKVQWGDNFCTSLTGKLVGGVFGREEYLNSYGDSKFATKCLNFRTVEDVKNGIEAPKDKLLNPSVNSSSAAFDDITPVDDGDMPF